MPDHLLSHGRGGSGRSPNQNKSGHKSTAIPASPDKSAMTSSQPGGTPMNMGSSGNVSKINPAGAGKPGGPTQTV